MKTPGGHSVKMTKLSGPRWRLEMGLHRLFIMKKGAYGATHLELLDGDLIRNYPVWDHAITDALRMFDKWDDADEPPKAANNTEEALEKNKVKYRVIWSGRTAQECTTTIMAYVDEKYWDNFFYVTLHVVDWELRRIVHTIDIPIDEKEGWAPDTAMAKIGTMIAELERFLRRYAYEFEQGVMTFNDIKI